MPQASFLSRHIISFTLIITFLGILVKSVATGKFGLVGIDNDDVMRLMQVQDFLNGQSWFDTTQYRMGPDGGTVMHWSRLVDLPIIILYYVFNLLLSETVAMSLAMSLWPPLTAGLVILGVSRGVRFIGGPFALGFACLLLALMLIMHYRFAPGSIDHHNIQLALLAIAVGYGLSSNHAARHYAVSGIALALSVAIGVEVYIFAGVICAYYALLWAFKGVPVAAGVGAFAVGFAGTLVLSFVMTVPPGSYGVIACDALSVVTISAAVTGGLGLWAATRFASTRTRLHRFAALTLIGILCVFVLGFTAPQCLNNPLDVLPPDMRALWLGHIDEAKPLLAQTDNRLFFIPYAIGATIVALCVAIWRIRHGDFLLRYGLLAALLVTGLVMTFYQNRFHVFGALFSVFVLAPWIAHIYAKARQSSGVSVGYIGAAAVSVPLFWGFPGILLSLGDDSQVGLQDKLHNGTQDENLVMTTAMEPYSCYSDAAMIELNTLAPGLVLATDNATPKILKDTHHRALTGNYHRNITGVMIAIRAYTQSPRDAQMLLRDAGVDYLYVCPGSAEVEVFSAYNPNGFMALMIAGNVPSFLQPVFTDTPQDAVHIYRFKR